MHRFRLFLVRYGVKTILGFKYGFLGMIPHQVEAMILTPEVDLKLTVNHILNPQSVKDIHQFGGTILGTSRGPQDAKVMVDFLVEKKVNMLFCIGMNCGGAWCFILKVATERNGELSKWSRKVRPVFFSCVFISHVLRDRLAMLLLF